MSHESSLLESVFAMKQVLQDALDELVSARTSTAQIGEALSSLERMLAEICTRETDEASQRLRIFVKLQDSFECNVSSRILSWMSLASARLEHITSKTPSDHERKAEIATLSTQLVQGLSIIQGVVLIHKASKRYLGRRYPLEVVLDLLLTSRHVAPMPLNTTTNTVSPPTSPQSGEGSARNPSPSTATISLASTVLDTLLCILVDSSPALRVFEDLSGVQLVVKILKRAGTPREVRMKCLEFLYFYLLDETTSISSSDTPQAESQAEPTSAPLDSSSDSPLSPSDHFRPSHRPIPSISTSASRDSSGSSYSSMFSNASASTSATSLSFLQATPKPSREYSSSSEVSGANLPNSTPALRAGIPGLVPSPRIVTPPNQRAQPRSLLMLRKDVDYVPLSPKKAQVSRLGVGGARAGSALRAKAKPRGTMDVLSSEDTEGEEAPQTPRPGGSSHARGYSVSSQSDASSIVSSPEALKTPLAGNRDRHRRAQSSADVMSGLSTPFQPARASSAAACLQNAAENQRNGARTMEEKKEILGSMLGNVDALVEGVRKAGIWGLG